MSNEQKTQTLEEAYDSIENGLSVEKNEPGLLRLKASIGINLFPTDIDTLYNVLKEWHDFSNHMDLNLLYHYGIILFKKDYYEDSKNIFNDLNFHSQGFPQRSSIKNSICLEEKGKRKQFYGIVKSLDSYSRKGYLECRSLPNLKYEIIFFPTRFSPTIGDYVVFNICFNMRGIFAYEVRKD